MSKVIRWTQNYLFCALPLALICMAWGSMQSENEILASAGFATRAAWEILAWHFMFWFAVLVVFLILLVVVPEAREKTLRRLANLKERDEREQMITGRASRAAYISTLSLMICLLFFSLVSVSIYRVPPAEAINGKTGTVKIGMDFSLLDKPRVEVNGENRIIFESREIPLSKSALILILIGWQLAAFNWTARKENLVGSD